MSTSICLLGLFLNKTYAEYLFLNFIRYHLEVVEIMQLKITF